MNSRKIIFIAPGKGRKDEAWSKEIKELSKFLTAKVLTTKKMRKIWKKEGRYIFINECFFFYSLFVLVVLFYSIRYDLIFFEFGPRFPQFSLLSKLLIKDKTIYRIKSESWLDKKRKYFRDYIHILKKIKWLILPNKASLQKAKKLFSSNKLIVIKPGINLELYPPQPVSKNGKRKFRLLFASGPLPIHPYPEIFEWKGITMLIEACKKLSKVYPLELYILWRGAFFKQLRKMISGKKSTDFIFPINKKVNPTKYYAITDCTVFPIKALKHSPDYPSSIMESISVGRPVITTKLPAISKIIEKNECGYVCDTTVNSLMEAIKKMIRNYDKLQKNCRKTAIEHFDLFKNSEKLRKICSEQ